MQSTIHDIDFIAVDAGPGAFTSLRVLLSTVNGLALAANKPVISCDGIALVGQCLAAKNNDSPASEPGPSNWIPGQAREMSALVLFNAYNNELYYHHPYSNETGYAPLDDIVAMIKTLPQPVVLAGQGVAIYEEQLRAAGVDLSCWDTELMYPPIKALAHDALLQWEKDEVKVFEAKPLHLKEQQFKKLSR